MKKSLIAGIALLAAASFAAPMTARADGTAPANPPVGPVAKNFMGKVTAVDATAMTVSLTNKSGEAKTFTLTAATKIKVNRKDATLADVKVDMHAGVKFAADGVTVESLSAGAGHGHKA